MRRLFAALLVSLPIIALAGVGFSEAAKDDTRLISLAKVVPGGKVNAAASPMSVSSDGRYVAFTTQADNIDADDTNGDEDIYVRDTVTETTTLVTPGDGPGDGSGSEPSISDDGMTLAFTSYDDLDPNDNNHKGDIYVADLTSDPPVLALVSRPSGTGAGAPAPPIASSSPSISGDGTAVGFVSSDNSLDSAHDADTLSGAYHSQDVFVRDLDTDTTELVSRGAVDGNRASWAPSLDSDGSHVSFDTQASNLDAADSDEDRDVYVRDRVGTTLTLASRADGVAGAKSDLDAVGPWLSGDGAVVSFISTASNLDPADPDATFDVFIRKLGTDDTQLISRAGGVAGVKANKVSQGASISNDGTKVAFISSADNLDPDMGTPGSTNFAYIRSLGTNTTKLQSRADGGSGAIADHGVGATVIAGGGLAIGFESNSTNLDPADPDTITDAYVRDTGSGNTLLASLAPPGAPLNANGSSNQPSISADGRYTAFASAATNLDPAATNNRADIFVFDAETGTIELASRADGPTGVEGDGNSSLPSVSADGRFVAFQSDAENLDGSSDGEQDIFVRDLENGTTTLASLTSTGLNAGGYPDEPSISGDGSRVAFSAEDPYHPDDGNVHSDIYVRDLSSNTTVIASRPDGVNSLTGSDASYLPAISDDGSSVAFESQADNLTGPSAVQQIVVRNIDLGTTTLASRADGQSGAAGSSESRRPSISADGTVVAFHTDSNNLDPDDPVPNASVYVRDLETAETTLASRAGDETPANGDANNAAVSGDGTYVVFSSAANNLDPASSDNRPDIYQRDLLVGTTIMVSRATGAAGAEGNDTDDGASISEHGRFVAFGSASTNLDPADDDSLSDVYLREVLAADELAPQTTITSGPSAGSFRNTTSFTFKFSASETFSTSECRFDAGSFAPCSGSFGTGKLGNGSHTFRVRSTDRVGNLEDPATVRSFTVDTLIKGRGIKAAKKQKVRGRVKVKVKVKSGEKVTVKLTGKVSAGGGPLKQIKRTVASGKSATLKAKLKMSKRNRKVKRRLAKGRKVVAKLTIRVTDRAGNVKTRKKTVRLR